MLRYVLYARKSSEGEDRQVQSIDAQLRVLRQLAEERGFSIVNELTETKSAKAEGMRPIFAQMLRVLKSGQADAVLCWSINRLSRNPEDSGRLAGMLQRGEIRAIQTPERLYSPADNVLLWAVDAGMANQDILELRRNTGRGTRQKVAQGWFPHRAPEGYLNTPHLPRGTRTILTDPERFGLVRQAFGLILAGTHSAAQAHQVLTREWGYRSRQRARTGGGPLPRTTFYGMTANIFYAGYFREGEEVHRGAHEPMLTLPEFARLQQIVKRERPARKTKHEFAYTRLIRCAHCGGLVTAEEKRKPSGRVYRYYHCKTAPCKRYHAREESLDEEVRRTLMDLKIEPEVADLLRLFLADWQQGQAVQTGAVREAQARAVTQVEKRLSGLLDLKLDGLVGEEEYRAKRDQLVAELMRLREEQEKGQSIPAQAEEALRGVVSFHEESLGLFVSGGMSLKRSLARSLGISYLLDRGKLRAEVSPVFRPIMEHRDELRRVAAEYGAAARQREKTRRGGEDQKEEKGIFQAGGSVPVRVTKTVIPLGRTLKTCSGSRHQGAFVPDVLVGSPNWTPVELLQEINRLIQETGIELPPFLKDAAC